MSVKNKIELLWSFLSVKNKIELLWSFLGGFCFTVFVEVLEQGSSDRYFDWGQDIFRLRNWFNFNTFTVEENLEHFIFGFLLTYIIIWSIKIYKK